MPFFENLQGSSYIAGTATKPADYVIAANPVYDNLFYASESVSFALIGATSTTTWTVTDYYGATVTSGTNPGSTLTLGVLTPGWYMLHFYGPVNDANFGFARGMTMFAVMRNTSGFVARPSNGGNIGGAGEDTAGKGLILQGPVRMKVSSVGNPSADFPAIDTDIMWQQQYYLPFDTARPKNMLIAFPNGESGSSATDTSGITAVVNRYGPLYYEWTNEPDIRNFAPAMQVFRNNVKNANPGAKVLGPCPVNIINGAVPVDAYLTAGGGAYVDAFSFHNYNGINGDLVMGRRTLDTFMTVLGNHGLSGIELWATEVMSSNFGAELGIFKPRKQAHWCLLDLLLYEQYGIPKERTVWYYMLSAGFWNYPSWCVTASQQPFPVVPMVRVYSEEVFGKTYQSKIDFGAPDNDFYLGNIYHSSTDGTNVAAIMTAGPGNANLTFAVSGGATSLTRISPFGVSSTLAVTGGKIAVPVEAVPSYVRLPAGVSLTYVGTTIGATPLSQSLATASDNASTSDVAKLNDGTIQNPYYYGVFDVRSTHMVWESSGSLPSWAKLTFANPVRLDTVIVRCPPPWQIMSTLTDFDVQYLDINDGTTWHTIQSPTLTPVTVNFRSDMAHGHNCMSEDYTDEQHVWTIKAAQTFTTKAVRVYIRATTYGGNTDANSGTGFGAYPNTGACGQGADVQYACIAEIAAYNSDLYVPRYAMA